MFSARDQNKLKRFLETSEPTKGPKRRLTPQDRSQELATKSRSRLSFARFRSLNEYLYSHSSSEANNYLSRELFITYHKTYEEIVKKWPKKPIDCVIERLERLRKDIRIADIGCGNRPLIKEAFPSLIVYSFDLISRHKDIIASDMTLLPLEDKAVDVCVYCLSLMATNLTDCLREANRVLSLNGTLIVAEVKSRFDPNEEQFVRQMRSLGFESRDCQEVNEFFILLEFSKVKEIKSSRLPTISLKPCVYKLR